MGVNYPFSKVILVILKLNGVKNFEICKFVNMAWELFSVFVMKKIIYLSFVVVMTGQHF